MIHIPDFIEEAIMAGIRPTIYFDASNNCFVYDMNLMAKSHMHITLEGDTWYAHMRYNEKYEVQDVQDLKLLAKHGMHGREFISADWAEFLMTDEERAQRKLAQDALEKLTPAEQHALKGYFK